MADISSYSDEIAEQASKAKQTVSKAVRDAKDRLNQGAHVMVEKAEETRDAAADAAQRASESLRAGAKNLPGADAAVDLAHAAVDKLDDAAQYLQHHDKEEMLADARSFVKRNPGKSVLAAVGVGFLVGWHLRRN